MFALTFGGWPFLLYLHIGSTRVVSSLACKCWTSNDKQYSVLRYGINYCSIKLYGADPTECKKNGMAIGKNQILLMPESRIIITVPTSSCTSCGHRQRIELHLHNICKSRWWSTTEFSLTANCTLQGEVVNFTKRHLLHLLKIFCHFMFRLTFWNDQIFFLIWN